VGAEFGEDIGIGRDGNGPGLAGGAALAVADGEIAGALGGEALEARLDGGEHELARAAGAGLQGADVGRGARQRLQSNEGAGERITGELIEQDAGDGAGVGRVREQE